MPRGSVSLFNQDTLDRLALFADYHQRLLHTAHHPPNHLPLVASSSSSSSSQPVAASPPLPLPSLMAAADPSAHDPLLTAALVGARPPFLSFNSDEDEAVSVALCVCVCVVSASDSLCGVYAQSSPLRPALSEPSPYPYSFASSSHAHGPYGLSDSHHSTLNPLLLSPPPISAAPGFALPPSASLEPSATSASVPQQPPASNAPQTDATDQSAKKKKKKKEKPRRPRVDPLELPPEEQWRCPMVA